MSAWMERTRGACGLAGAVALVYTAIGVSEPIGDAVRTGNPHISPLGWLLLVSAPAGWAWLVWACWFRKERIGRRALAFVVALGLLGTAATLPALGARGELALVAVLLMGLFVLNGLGLCWLAGKVGRIMVESNRDD